jgi:hypothetical protein
MSVETARELELTRSLLERRGLVHADGTLCRIGQCWDLIGVSLRFKGLRTPRGSETYCPCPRGHALAQQEARQRNERARAKEASGAGSPERYRWFVLKSAETRSL